MLGLKVIDAKAWVLAKLYQSSVLSSVSEAEYARGLAAYRQSVRQTERAARLRTAGTVGQSGRTALLPPAAGS